MERMQRKREHVCTGGRRDVRIDLSCEPCTSSTSSPISNAHELIAEYWRSQPKDKQQRYADSKSGIPVETTGKLGRSVDVSEPEEEVTSRGRKRNRSQGKGQNKDEEHAHIANDPRATKMPRKTGARLDSVPRSSPFSYGSGMAEYMHLNSWEHLIARVETIENINPQFAVYFIL